MFAYKTTSHMLKHALEKHEGEKLEDIKFLAKVLRFHNSAFERQIHESILIQAYRNHNILNSRSEYNRCALPRLQVKLGEKELKERREEEAEKDRKDEELEKKILSLRRENVKQKGKERLSNEGQPTKKRQKVDNNVQCPYV